MKTQLLLLSLVSVLANAEVNQSVTNTTTSNVPTQSSTNINSAWVDQKIEEIKPQRSGLSHASLARLKSPFIVIREEPKEGTVKKVPVEKKPVSDPNSIIIDRKDMSKEPLTLQIVLNSTALINGKWLKENDDFRSYKVAKIQRDHVVLERKNKTIKLFIAQKSKNINISTK